MLKEPMLTIGIPTYNRALDLRDCILSIAPQLEGNNGAVEVLVCDNASNDETKGMIVEMSERMPFLRYSRNSTNIGPDRNFIEVLAKAKGAYVWLMGDDDLLTDGAVKEVLRIIRQYQPAYISTNYSWCDYPLRAVANQSQKRFMVTTDIAGADINRVFSERNISLSFISASIFRRQLLDIQDYQLHVDRLANWIQIYMVAHVLSHCPKGFLSSNYAVLGRRRSGNLDFATFLNRMPEAFHFVFDKFAVDRSVEKQILRSIRSVFLPFRRLLSFRAAGGKPSPLLAPYTPSHFYLLARLIPRQVVLLAWRSKRLLTGRGFSIHGLESIASEKH